jgi:hypothetical protein
MESIYRNITVPWTFLDASDDAKTVKTPGAKFAQSHSYTEQQVPALAKSNQHRPWIETVNSAMRKEQVEARLEKVRILTLVNL